MRNEPTFLFRVPPLFDVHGMLGGLVKWLRILGFDAAFPCMDRRHGRIFVTSSLAKRYPDAVYVSSDTVFAQLKDVARLPCRDVAGPGLNQFGEYGARPTFITRLNY